MKLHFLLAGIAAVGLLASPTDARARGGGGGGGGGFHGGGGGFHGGGHFGGFRNGGFHGRNHRFFRGRFFGPGFGFYGYPYPWWWDWDYYGYYPGPYYGYDSDYSGPNDSSDDPRFDSVRRVQAALAWRGYYSGRIDGVMGPETRRAIRSFQAHQGSPATGQVDSGLVDELRR